MSEQSEEPVDNIPSGTQWLIKLADELLERAEEYPDFLVVTLWLEHDAEEEFASDMLIRSPLLDISADDKYIRFETRGLKRGTAHDSPPAMRLSNLGIRLRRLASEVDDYSAAFVQGFTNAEENYVWHVYPVQRFAVRINEEDKLLCLVGRGWPGRWTFWMGLRYSAQRIWSGIRRSFEDD